METTMVQAQSGKAPIEFTVLPIGEEIVWPPFAMSLAGGNSVLVRNLLKKPLEVSHGGHLDAPNPFTVPAHVAGPPPTVTYPVAAGSDVSGMVFQIHIEASRVNAFGLAGDPTIIIL
jgi:hypothetical protein